MTIAKTEAALVKMAADCLATVDVASGPGAISGSYVARLLSNLPAVRIVFLGGENTDPAGTGLKVDGSWAAIVFTGWKGGAEKHRRIGVDAAYAILARLSAIYHSAMLQDENGENISRVEVHQIENLWSSSWDLANIAAFSIRLETDLSLDIEDQDLKGALADFRTMGHDIDLPGEGQPVDLPGISPIPQ